MFGFRKRRRRRLRATALPGQWWTIIDRNIPMTAEMSEADRAELGGIVQVLLHEKKFEGCDGFEITDEVRITIAAQAAVLLMHRDTDYYPTLKSILVYPSAYVAKTMQQMPDGTMVEGQQTRLGESWFGGDLVLSWADVLRGASDDDDGRNVTLHEFAHQLDGEAGGMEGAPQLARGHRYRDWARVLGGEYEKLVGRVYKGHKTLLDGYGASNPAEFFAVATELFFERPSAMKRRHPELYAELARFYQQDHARD